eukprot:2731843-Alexandrium_andersonii.AAC.1
MSASLVGSEMCIRDRYLRSQYRPLPESCGLLVGVYIAERCRAEPADAAALRGLHAHGALDHHWRRW